MVKASETLNFGTAASPIFPAYFPTQHQSKIDQDSSKWLIKGPIKKNYEGQLDHSQ